MPTILAGGSIGFLLEAEATADKAAELAWDLNASVAALTYHVIPDCQIPSVAPDSLD